MQCPTSQTRMKAGAHGKSAGRDIFFRLTLGVQHQDVPGAICTAPAARGGLGHEEVGLALDLLVAALLLAGLFGLQHEAIALVEVDAPVRDSPLAPGLLHDALEHIVVRGMFGGGGLGMRQAEGVAELGQE